jgi:hypothetical protein
MSNWASVEFGAKLLSSSSHISGCEAGNVLQPKLSQLWLSEENMPQWIQLSLKDLVEQDVYIRTIGWHCWHPYITNPKTVIIHISMDGSKFRVWDTFTAECVKGNQLFCCTPIRTSIYPYIVLEVVETFGGLQTYMNRVFMFSEEVPTSVNYHSHASREDNRENVSPSTSSSINSALSPIMMSSTEALPPRVTSSPVGRIDAKRNISTEQSIGTATTAIVTETARDIQHETATITEAARDMPREDADISGLVRPGTKEEDNSVEISQQPLAEVVDELAPLNHNGRTDSHDDTTNVRSSSEDPTPRTPPPGGTTESVEPISLSSATNTGPHLADQQARALELLGIYADSDTESDNIQANEAVSKTQRSVSGKETKKGHRRSPRNDHSSDEENVAAENQVSGHRTQSSQRPDTKATTPLKRRSKKAADSRDKGGSGSSINASRSLAPRSSRSRLIGTLAGSSSATSPQPARRSSSQIVPNVAASKSSSSKISRTASATSTSPGAGRTNPNRSRASSSASAGPVTADAQPKHARTRAHHSHADSKPAGTQHTRAHHSHADSKPAGTQRPDASKPAGTQRPDAEMAPAKTSTPSSDEDKPHGYGRRTVQNEGAEELHASAKDISVERENEQDESDTSSSSTGNRLDQAIRAGDADVASSKLVSNLQSRADSDGSDSDVKDYRKRNNQAFSLHQKLDQSRLYERHRQQTTAAATAKIVPQDDDGDSDDDNGHGMPSERIHDDYEDISIVNSPVPGDGDKSSDDSNIFSQSPKASDSRGLLESYFEAKFDRGTARLPSAKSKAIKPKDVGGRSRSVPPAHIVECVDSETQTADDRAVERSVPLHPVAEHEHQTDISSVVDAEVQTDELIDQELIDGSDLHAHPATFGFQHDVPHHPRMQHQASDNIAAQAANGSHLPRAPTKEFVSAVTSDNHHRHADSSGSGYDSHPRNRENAVNSTRHHSHSSANNSYHESLELMRSMQSRSSRRPPAGGHNMRINSGVANPAEAPNNNIVNEVNNGGELSDISGSIMTGPSPAIRNLRSQHEAGFAGGGNVDPVLTADGTFQRADTATGPGGSNGGNEFRYYGRAFEGTNRITRSVIYNCNAAIRPSFPASTLDPFVPIPELRARYLGTDNLYFSNLVGYPTAASNVCGVDDANYAQRYESDRNPMVAPAASSSASVGGSTVQYEYAPRSSAPGLSQPQPYGTTSKVNYSQDVPDAVDLNSGTDMIAQLAHKLHEAVLKRQIRAAKLMLASGGTVDLANLSGNYL